MGPILSENEFCSNSNKPRLSQAGFVSNLFLLENEALLTCKEINEFPAVYRINTPAD
jgi:hypothetical protein